MNATAVITKPLAAVRLATAAETASGFDAEFGPIFGRLYPIIYGALGQVGVTPAGPSYALYDERGDGQIDVIAGVPIAPDVTVKAGGVEVRDLPAVARAATLIHHGSMDAIKSSYETLMNWIVDSGEEPVGYSREVYLAMTGDPSTWVTELQFVLK